MSGKLQLVVRMIAQIAMALRPCRWVLPPARWNEHKLSEPVMLGRGRVPDLYAIKHSPNVIHVRVRFYDSCN